MNWCVFYVADYKGGELYMYSNITVGEVIEIISNSLECFDDYYDSNEYDKLTDDEMWRIWNDWYKEEDQHNLYAYDTYSERLVFRIKDNKLVEDFPTKEDFIKYFKKCFAQWKTNG